jgi:uncharacterized protein with FMN-binding domain
MKRAILIAGGTVGGLGAVLSVTPPQLGGSGLTTIAGASASTSVPVKTSAVTTAATQSSNTSPVTSSKPTTVKKTTTKKTTTKKTTTVTPTASASAAASSSTSSTVNGSFTGDAINVSYGIVQVKITVSNGKITDAVAVQSPTGRSQRFSDYALPNLHTQTLAVQSAAIQGVSGASYTSYGWYKSLISALQKAGMKTGV